MKKIVYTRKTGSLSIVHPNYNNKLESESEDEFLERVKTRSVPKDARDVRIVNESDLPTDRSVRSAWKPDLTIDEDQAAKIKRERLLNLDTLIEALLEKGLVTNADIDDAIGKKKR
jgi:hypothetical protein